MNMKITADDITVYGKKIKKPSKILAQFTVVICEQIEIHGFTVSISKEIHKTFQEMIWIQPPKTIPPYWKKIVFIRDEFLWMDVENKIYNAFRELNINYKSREEVDINDIPDHF